jgi:hypothetical protein
MGRGECFRGKAVAQCPTKAAARRLTSASRGSTCASSGLCCRPPRAARQLSAWQCKSPAVGGRGDRDVAIAIVSATPTSRRKRLSARPTAGRECTSAYSPRAALGSPSSGIPARLMLRAMTESAPWRPMAFGYLHPPRGSWHGSLVPGVWRRWRSTRSSDASRRCALHDA